MTKLEIFKNLSIEEKKEIIDSYLTEDKKAEEMTIIQYLFLKCVTICEETNTDNIKIESHLKKLNKTAKFIFTLTDK